MVLWLVFGPLFGRFNLLSVSGTGVGLSWAQDVELAIAQLNAPYKARESTGLSRGNQSEGYIGNINIFVLMHLRSCIYSLSIVCNNTLFLYYIKFELINHAWYLTFDSKVGLKHSVSTLKWKTSVIVVPSASPGDPCSSLQIPDANVRWPQPPPPPAATQGEDISHYFDSRGKVLNLEWFVFDWVASVANSQKQVYLGCPFWICGCRFFEPKQIICIAFLRKVNRNDGHLHVKWSCLTKPIESMYGIFTYI